GAERTGAGLLDAGKLPPLAHDAALRLLAHDAGVEHHDIGGLDLFRLGVAPLLEGGGHVVAVGHVHLAADGPDVEAPGACVADFVLTCLHCLFHFRSTWWVELYLKWGLAARWKL